jgi:Peptidase M50B-like
MSLHREMLGRVQQAWLIISTLLVSWLVMQGVHELGHVVAAWLTGGQVTRVVLHPLTISRTDVDPNPNPPIVVWSGPIVGVVVPLLAWAIAAAAKLRASFLRFFAAFCLIANGAYIGLGSFERVGDCGIMLRYGSPIWLLWLFGIATVPAGLWLIDGTRDYFGVGKNKSRVNPPAIVVTSVALFAVVIIEVAAIPRQ